ncbi:uncharacterized protein LOC111378711 [Olea europaea var. sylvestris]|uniref:uncharacterized protein LOC111378711 n=1 Tax=Olea europaea var. sylvestris TaxID=158386 RepID=UPI000C1D2FA9|nr:uncharacterized protein LOC111378711 [Olea europaea var. sylvestris]
MVLCATSYEIEKQFQAVYTISKFRKVQAKFMGKVYCDIISSMNGCSETTYEVRDDVLYGDRWKRKTFVVLFERENHEIILRRWRKDVSRAHTKVTVNYIGLVSTPGQLRYDRICQAYTTTADLVAKDEARTHTIMEWIGVQQKELMSSSCSILDPKVVNKKGTPKKLRRKSLLESTSKKPKAPLTSSKGKIPTARCTCPPDGASSVQGDHENQVFAQQFPGFYIDASIVNPSNIQFSR